MKLPPIKVLPPKNDFRTELLGIAANQPFVIFNSPARQQMYTNSHLAQKLVTFGMSENFLSTDMAEVLAKATFNIMTTCSTRILKIVQRYPDNNIGDEIAINPETLVWYEDDNSKKVGLLTIPRYKSYHPYFGYDLVPQPAAALLTPTNTKPIPAGTVLFDSPGRSPSGRYMHGVMVNTAFMGHPGTAEDGLIVSRAILPAFRFKRYEKRTMEWGDKTFPLNLYGDDKVYKIFPDIGEFVRDDGLICGARDINRRLAPVDMSVNGTRRIDGTGDHLLYAKGKGGRVVDVIVTLNYEFETKGLADVNQQLLKYIKARKRFNVKMIEEYMRLYKSRPGLEVTHELHSQILQCMKDEGYNGQKFFKVFKKVGLDQIRVDFVIEYEVEPNIGFKLTESHGG